MSDEITIQGKRYRLVPVEEETHSVLDDYQVKVPELESRQEVPKENEPSGLSEIQDAVPTVSDYRERYKQRKIKASEIQVAPKIIEVEDKTEGMLEGYEYKGENLFFGSGLEQDI